MKPIVLGAALSLLSSVAAAQPAPTKPVGTPPAATPAPSAPARKPPVISPEIAADRQVTFRLSAPEAKAVVVTGQWTKDKIALSKGADGIWSATVGPVEPGLWEYSLVVDGVQMIDPGNVLVKPMRRPRTSILDVPAQAPQLTDFQEVPHGTVHVLNYRSKVANAVRRVHVYTPPGYESKAAARFPVLYLLHGSGDNDATWVVHGRAHWVLDNLIAQGKAKPMVVVMTDGHLVPETPPRDLREIIGDNSELYRRDLLEQVMPLVEKTFRVRTDAANRAIAGLSMGGHQSLTVGLNHADKFAWVAGFSSAPPAHDKMPLGDAKGLNKKLRWFWIGCGKDDFLLKRNEELVAALKEKGVNHVWRLTEGGHSWPVWRAYLIETLPQLFTPPAKS